MSDGKQNVGPKGFQRNKLIAPVGEYCARWHFAGGKQACDEAAGFDPVQFTDPAYKGPGLRVLDVTTMIMDGGSRQQWLRAIAKAKASAKLTVRGHEALNLRGQGIEWEEAPRVLLFVRAVTGTSGGKPAISKSELVRVAEKLRVVRVGDAKLPLLVAADRAGRWQLIAQTSGRKVCASFPVFGFVSSPHCDLDPSAAITQHSWDSSDVESFVWGSVGKDVVKVRLDYADGRPSVLLDPLGSDARLPVDFYAYYLHAQGAAQLPQFAVALDAAGHELGRVPVVPTTSDSNLAPYTAPQS